MPAVASESPTEKEPMDPEGLREYRNRLDAQRSPLFEDRPIAPDVREACRENVSGTLDLLVALGLEGSSEDALDVLRRCIEPFNELDDGFICTIEREELCEILCEIGDPCGLGGGDDWVDQWRDW